MATNWDKAVEALNKDDAQRFRCKLNALTTARQKVAEAEGEALRALGLNPNLNLLTHDDVYALYKALGRRVRSVVEVS